MEIILIKKWVGIIQFRIKFPPLQRVLAQAIPLNGQARHNLLQNAFRVSIHLYLIFRHSVDIVRLSVITFAAISGMSPISSPYVSHRKPPPALYGLRKKCDCGRRRGKQADYCYPRHNNPIRISAERIYNYGVFWKLSCFRIAVS